MRRRLLVTVIATTTLVVVAFAIPLAGLVRSVARDRAITAAERDASALAPVLAITNDDDLLRAAIARTNLGADGRLAVVLAGGTAVGDGTPLHADAMDVAQQRQRAFSVDDDDGLTLYSPVVTGTGDVSVIRARIPAELLRRGVREAWAALAFIAVVLIVSAAFIADRLARSLTREAAGVGATARALAGGDPSARVVPGPTPELADAAHALNLLADRIGALRAAERERVADLSHRLRTPLTALRLDVERAGNAELVEGVDRLEAAVTDLIRDARRPLHDSPVNAQCDLAAIARDRLGYWSALAEDDGRQWQADLPDAPITVRLRDDELAAAIDALIGNVFAHTPDGTPYHVAARVDDGHARFTVDDAGPGIGRAEDALRRGATGSGSTGLGIDIARQAAEAAGGELTIATSPMGGARVEMRFPAA